MQDLQCRFRLRPRRLALPCPSRPTGGIPFRWCSRRWAIVRMGAGQRHVARATAAAPFLVLRGGSVSGRSACVRSSGPVEVVWS